jgi:putative nucleotidyltransferase with HDIG domain
MLTPGNSHYSRIVESIRELPSLPSIVTRLVEVVNSPDTSAADAAELIEKDPALTSKMLRLANSAFYGIPRTISSISSAVVILGFNTIRSIALSATIMKMFSDSAKKGVFDYNRFWLHSIVCAMTAKNIAQHYIATMSLDPEAAFCAGILHDIGKLIFMQFLPTEYAQTINYSRSGTIATIDAEKQVLGITHAQIGTILADKWALPVDLEYSIVFHHGPERADKVEELVAVVHMADVLCHAAKVSIWDEEGVPGESPQARALLGIDDADWRMFVEQTNLNLVKSRDFFTIIR